MKQKMYPIIVSTMEALNLSIKDEYSVIYVDNGMLADGREQILEFMSKHGYIVPKKEGKSGMFFVKETGRSGFDPRKHEIYDPYDTL